MLDYVRVTDHNIKYRNRRAKEVYRIYLLATHFECWYVFYKHSLGYRTWSCRHEVADLSSSVSVHLCINDVRVLPGLETTVLSYTYEGIT